MKRATIVFLCFALCSAATAQQRLREGIVVDAARNAAWVMTPDGGIAEVALDSGQVRWTTNEAAKPLALIGNRLVAQKEPKTVAQQNRLELVALDVQQRGAPVARNSADLPDGVVAGVTRSLDGQFTTFATGSGSNAIVTWRYVPAPMRGMPPPKEEGLGPNVRKRGPVAGSLQMNLATGAMSRTRELASARAAEPARTWVISGSEITPQRETQYESADGRHVLTSERVAEDPEWNKYRWTISERATGRRIGEFRNHLSFTPFVVRDSVVVFETTPYILGKDEQPAKLRGVDLQTGREAWSIEVREVEYRGSAPP